MPSVLSTALGLRFRAQRAGRSQDIDIGHIFSQRGTPGRTPKHSSVLKNTGRLYYTRASNLTVII